jgi:phenylpropionate dioxygenase-like ring-hydroxylating dioxygenase large terminal subunit
MNPIATIDPYSELNSSELENELIFKRLWIFVGTTNLIKNRNDYIVRNIANQSILIRNDGEEFKAFINKCPHRGSKLCVNESGNQTLQCPFHGWSFHNNGDIKIIPFEEQLYCFDSQTKNNIRLTSCSLEVLGKFIFINLDPFAISINEQFPAEMINELKEISNFIDDNISFTRIEANINWKLIMEITMDEAHVPFVHSKSLNKLRSYAPSDFSRIDIIDADKPFTLKELSFKHETPHENAPNLEWHKDVERFKNNNSYYDFYFFPNLHLVCSDGGYSFSYENLYPNSFSQTNIFYAYMTCKKTKNNRFFKLAHLESMRYGLKVYNEDIAMMEIVQSNLSDKPVDHFSGKYEYRIKRWRKYFELLKGDKV